MTSRSEKPSDNESSTDTIIATLEIVACLVEDFDDDGLYYPVVRDAAKRLDKLEKEIEFMRSPEYLAGRWELADKSTNDDGSVVIK